MKKTILAVMLCLVMVGLPLSSAYAQHKKVTLELYTNPSGGIMYTLGFALSEFINKNSEWLRCNAIETASTVENLRNIVGHPEKKNVWFGEAVTIGVDQLALGMKPYKGVGPWRGTKWLALMVNIGSPQVTLDPNIKTWRDLEGKTYGLDVMGSTNQFMQEWLMDHAWKNRDRVRIEYGCTTNLAVDRLLDGTIDITWQGAICLGPEDYKEWKPMPAFERLLSARKVYFMELEEEHVRIVRQKTGLEAMGLIGGKAKKVGKTDAPNWKGLLNQIGWLVHEDMDPEIVNEIMRIIYTYSDEFVKYHAVGRGITKQTLGQLSVPRESYHPAAVTFLESRGQKVGR